MPRDNQGLMAPGIGVYPCGAPYTAVDFHALSCAAALPDTAHSCFQSGYACKALRIMRMLLAFFEPPEFSG